MIFSEILEKMHASNPESVTGNIPHSSEFKRMAEWQFGDGHGIAIRPFNRLFPNLVNGNSVTNSRQIAIRPITLNLKRKRNQSYSECTTLSVRDFLLGTHTRHSVWLLSKLTRPNRIL